MKLSSNLEFLLKRRGVTATLNKNTYGAYDTSTGSSSVAPNPITVKMYFAEYLLEEVNDNTLLGDRKVLISPFDTSGVATPEPDSGDTIEGVGDTLIVKGVQKIYNASTLVCYICQARE